MAELSISQFVCFSDVDECFVESHGCHGNASCANTEGSYTCTCNRTFTGDGENCTSKSWQNSNDQNLKHEEMMGLYWLGILLVDKRLCVIGSLYSEMPMTLKANLFVLSKDWICICLNSLNSAYENLYSGKDRSVNIVSKYVSQCQHIITDVPALCDSQSSITMATVLKFLPILCI